MFDAREPASGDCLFGLADLIDAADRRINAADHHASLCIDDDRLALLHNPMQALEPYDRRQTKASGQNGGMRGRAAGIRREPSKCMLF